MFRAGITYASNRHAWHFGLLLWLYLMLLPRCFSSEPASPLNVAVNTTIQAVGQSPYEQLQALLSPQEQAYLRAHQVLTVQNEANFAPYSYLANNAPAGFNVDYLQLFADAMHVKFKFISGLSWDKYMTLLKNNDIDIIFDIAKTPEREQFALFSKATHSSPMSLAIVSQKKRIKNLADLKGKRLAIIKGYFQNELIRRYYPGITIIPVNDAAAGLALVAKQQADAFMEDYGVSNYFIAKYGFNNLTTILVDEPPHFPISESRIATNKQNPLLLSILNKAIEVIPDVALLQLRQKWFGSGNIITELSLTPQEQSYLKQHPSIRVQNEADYPPFNYQVDGEPVGYSIDLMKLITDKLGIKAQFVQHKTWSEYLNMLAEQQLDAMLNIVATPERERFATFTSAYAQGNIFTISRIGDFNDEITPSMLVGKRIALVRNYASNVELKALLSESEFVLCDDVLAALRAVANNQADITFETGEVSNFYIKKHYMINLSLKPVSAKFPLTEEPLRIATHKNNKLLASLLQKTLNTIPEQQLVQLRNKWFAISNGRSNDIADNRLILTAQEKQYLSEHPYITVQNEDNYPPFNYQVDGKAVGYSIDLMNLLASTLGIRAKFIQHKTWTEFINMLANRQMDAMVNIVDTPERRKFAIFTKTYAEASNFVVFRKGEFQGNITLQQLTGKRIAIVRDYAISKSLKNTFSNNQFVTVASVLEALQAVSTHKADLFFESGAVSNYYIKKYFMIDLALRPADKNLRLIEQPLTIATHKDNKILSGLLDKALAAIPEQQRLELRNKWFISTGTTRDATGDKLPLSHDELQYVQQHPVLHVQNDDFPPFIFQVNGKVTGFGADLINLVAGKLGMTVNFVSDKTWAEYLTMLKNNQLDAIVDILATEQRKSFASFTSPFANVMTFAIIRKNEALQLADKTSIADKKIAIVRQFAKSIQLQQQMPNGHFIVFDNALDALKAVANGQADIYFEGEATANYYIEKHFMANLKLIPVGPTIDLPIQPYTIATNKDNPILFGMLNKALASVPESELIRLRKKWTSQSKDNNDIKLTTAEYGFLARHPTLTVGVVSDFMPFNFYENDKAQGFSVDLMRYIASLLNINIEFKLNDWSSHLRDLQQRNIDVLLDTKNTKERRKNYVSFSQPYIKSRNVLIVNNQQKSLNSLADLKDKTIAAMPGYSTTTQLETKYPDIKLRYVKSNFDALTAVAQGSVSATIGNEIVARYLIHKHFITNLSLIPLSESYLDGETTHSLAVKLHNELLRGILDQALLAIPESELIKLREKWFGNLDTNINTLNITSKQQKSWLISHNRQTLLLPDFGAPLSQRTEQGLQGIIPDLLSYFEEQMAIEWRRQPDNNRKLSDATTTPGKPDVIVSDAPTPPAGYIFTKAVVRTPVVVVSTPNAAYVKDLSTLNSQSIAVIAGANYQQDILQSYDNLTPKKYDSIKNAIMAINRGDVSLLLCPLSQCSYSLNEQGANSLKIIAQVPVQQEIRFAVRRDWQELAVIIDQIIDNMSPQLKNSIYKRWNTREDLLVKTDYQLLWYLFISAFLIIAAIVLWNRKIANYAAKIQLAHEELKNAQQQLLQSEKMASIGTMTAGIAHEINNPTNFTHAAVYMMGQEIVAIKSFLVQLAGGEHADKQVLQAFDEQFKKLIELTETAREGTERIKNIVTDLRIFTRLDTDEQKTAQIADIIKSTLQLVKTQYHSIDISTDIGANPPLLCFPSKLGQVLMNLTINACQAITSKQSVQKDFQGQLSLSTALVDDQLSICFKDNGIGMDKHTQSRIFDPFFTTKSVGQGTGLGMAISFAIIEEHGGHIRVVSEPDVGTTITVYLPVLAAAKEAREAVAEPTTATQEPDEHNIANYH